MNFGDPVWEDIIKPIKVGSNTKPILLKDWDVAYSNAGDAYIVFSGNSATFRLPLHHTASDPNSGKVDKKMNKTYFDLVYSGEAQPQLNFCAAYAYDPSGVRSCAKTWDHYIKLPLDFINTFKSDSHKGYVLEDVFNASMNNAEKYFIRNVNVGAPPCDNNTAIAIGTPNYEKFNKKCETLDPMERNFNTWISDARGHFVDSHDLFNVRCNSVRCEVAGRNNILNYYTPPYMSSACGPDGCKDNEVLYPDLMPGDLNSGCKRGYNWGILNENEMWTAKSCGGIFVDRKGNQTSCDRPGCVIKDSWNYTPKSSSYAGDCNYEIIKCPINAAVAGSGIKEPEQKHCIDAEGIITPADEHGKCGSPTCYVGDKPICSTGYNPKCIAGTWESCPKPPEDDTTWTWILIIICIIIISIAVVVIQKNNVQIPLSAIS